MALYHILFIAIIQGLTEFLPVSSSGHLVLTHHLFGNGTTDLCWVQNKIIDIAVHVGTLFSVLVYFRHDLIDIGKGLLTPGSEGFRLGIHLVIASIPVVIVGFFLSQIKPNFLCLLEIMAWATLTFGIVLWLADKYGSNHKKIGDMTIIESALIGFSQAIALIPGTSRSGITMIAGRFFGYGRTEAARFSLLLSIVAISGAGTLSVIDLSRSGNIALGFDAFLAALLAFLVGLAAIALLMRWLQKASFTPFAIYRIILGLILLTMIYGGIF